MIHFCLTIINIGLFQIILVYLSENQLITSKIVKVTLRANSIFVPTKSNENGNKDYFNQTPM